MHTLTLCVSRVFGSKLVFVAMMSMALSTKFTFGPSSFHFSTRAPRALKMSPISLVGKALTLQFGKSTNFLTCSMNS